MFDRLPVELLDNITKGLPIKDLKSLSLASKLFYAVCAHKLWNSICINIPRVKGKKSLFDINRVDHCASALQSAEPALHNARNLVFRRDLRWTSWAILGLVERQTEEHSEEATDETPDVPCFHRQPDPESNSAARDGRNKLPVDDMHRLARMATSVIELIPKDQLDSFSWDLATCIPDSVLGALFAKQPRLTSLRLTTDASCCTPGGQVSIPFRHLTQISWRGPSSTLLGSLQEMLEKNREHLAELEIGLHRYIVTVDDADSDREDDWYDGDGDHPLLDRDNVTLTPFSQVLPKARPVFPSLTVLSLSNVSLGGKMREAIDISALKSLTIRNCPMWDQFLKRHAEAETPVCLETLEIKAEDDDKEDFGICQFLVTFCGLKELFLEFSRPVHYSGTLIEDSETNPLWDVIAENHFTLKKLVVHQRGREPGLQACRLETMDYHFDAQHLEMPQLARDEWKLDPSTHPMAALELECLGMPYDVTRNLESLREMLEPCTSKSTLKLLHLRQTGSDFKCRGSRAMTYPRGQYMYGYSHCREHIYTVFPPHDLEGMLLPAFASFLDWAFGPTGIISLEVVAFGDFAHGRNGWALHNLFVCRSSLDKKYRVFDARDRANEHEWIDTRHKYRNFLESCPVAPLVDACQWQGYTTMIYGF
ncbi:hypothetical protein B0T21DRAFT_389915 [Apiosordaria backusii]|uniref:F-box domain-containing protein n=1 Tax=Apiosordaria backusii TaxID=314023 RepID=A0AA40ESJ4_9PEZI|nr:hypothetical protein B0T21DRAFT_389915 [Apiosordaria backusii]